MFLKCSKFLVVYVLLYPLTTVKVYRPLFFLFIDETKTLLIPGSIPTLNLILKSLPSSKYVFIIYLQVTFWAKRMVKKSRKKNRLSNLYFQLLLLPIPRVTMHNLIKWVVNKTSWCYKTRFLFHWNHVAKLREEFNCPPASPHIVGAPVDIFRKNTSQKGVNLVIIWGILYFVFWKEEL